MSYFQDAAGKVRVMAPSRDEQTALHNALLRSDPTAPARIVKALLGPLVERLRWKWPYADLRDLEQQAADSVLHYLDAPWRYDPKRASLLHYLVLDAHCDLLNAYNAPRSLEEIPHEDVAVAADPRNNDWDEFSAAQATREDAELELQLDGVFPNPADRAVVELLRDRVRANAAYAAALGISHLPIDQQNQEVKRVKDRIKKKLRRLVGESR
jgi:hypothetical protein